MSHYLLVYRDTKRRPGYASGTPDLAESPGWIVFRDESGAVSAMAPAAEILLIKGIEKPVPIVLAADGEPLPDARRVASVTLSGGEFVHGVEIEMGDGARFWYGDVREEPGLGAGKFTLGDGKAIESARL